MVKNHNSKRRRLLPEHRREELLAAAERVLLEHGYQASTVQRIVDEAGVARGSFYRYFKSRDHIFTELIQQVILPLEQAVSGLQLDDVRTRLDYENAVLPFYTELANQLSRRPHLLKEALLAAPSHSGKFGEHAAEFLDTLRSVGEGFIHGYCGRPPFRKMPMPNVAATALVGLVVGAALAAIESSSSFDPHDWAREVASMEAAIFAEDPNKIEAT